MVYIRATKIQYVNQVHVQKREKRNGGEHRSRWSQWNLVSSEWNAYFTLQNKRTKETREPSLYARENKK